MATAKKKAPAKKASPNPYTESMRGVPQDLIDKTVAQQRRNGSRPTIYGRAPGGGPQRLQTGDRVRGVPGRQSLLKNGPRLDYTQPGTKKQMRGGTKKNAR